MLRAYGDDVYGLKPHVGHFLQVSRLDDGRVRLEISQGVMVTYVNLSADEARMVGRLLTGGGPQLPELPKLRKVG